jgi:hypothetical protein
MWDGLPLRRGGGVAGDVAAGDDPAVKKAAEAGAGGDLTRGWGGVVVAPALSATLLVLSMWDGLPLRRGGGVAGGVAAGDDPAVVEGWDPAEDEGDVGVTPSFNVTVVPVGVCFEGAEDPLAWRRGEDDDANVSSDASFIKGCGEPPYPAESSLRDELPLRRGGGVAGDVAAGEDPAVREGWDPAEDEEDVGWVDESPLCAFSRVVGRFARFWTHSLSAVM